jgi:hypothetical protein
VRRGLARLHATIAEQCPGEHRYVDRRNGRFPSCPECGYTDTGLRRSEIRRDLCSPVVVLVRRTDCGRGVYGR